MAGLLQGFRRKALFQITALLVVLAGLLIELCREASMASEPAKDLTAEVILFTTDPWLGVIGSDSPRLALYDDGTIIYKKLQANRQLLLNAKLQETDKREIIEAVREGLGDVKPKYALTGATDMPTNILWWRNGGTAKRVSVYGRITPEPLDAKEAAEKACLGDQSLMPAPLLKAFRKLLSFDSQTAQEWLPENIEVMVWPFEYSQDKPIQWPSSWPDLKDPQTVKRNELYSISLPSKHFPELRKLIKSLRATTAVEMNGKKWAISYRFPFPDESAVRSAVGKH